MNFSKADVLEASLTYGSQMKVAPPLDGRGVMLALSSNESSFGADCGPRHEPAYDIGGSLSHGQEQALLLQQYPNQAACSFGPWQMMFVNFTPYAHAKIANGTVELIDYAQEFVRFFNRYVIGVRKAASLAEIGEVWNLGHIGPDPVYVAKLEKAYFNWENV
jgi:hypothetical protein